MKKTVKCSGCGKEHEIEHTVKMLTGIIDGFPKENITFKPVVGIKDRIMEEFHKISCEDRVVDILYLGKGEVSQLEGECAYVCLTHTEIVDRVYGFKIVRMALDSYFHATSRAGAQ